jgi:Uma2 family endonuclease
MPPSAKDAPVIGFLPATLVPDQHFTNDSLERLARTTLDEELIRCERTADGKLRLYPPTSSTVRSILMRINTQLSFWVEKNGPGGYALMRRRFFLKGGVMMSPDIAYLHTLPGQEDAERAFSRPLEICPDFVVEICPNPGQLGPLKSKMAQWLASGVREGWLVVPQLETVFTYHPGMEPDEMNSLMVVAGPPIDGFGMFLDEIWHV